MIRMRPPQRPQALAWLLRPAAGAPRVLLVHARVCLAYLSVELLRAHLCTCSPRWLGLPSCPCSHAILIDPRAESSRPSRFTARPHGATKLLVIHFSSLFFNVLSLAQHAVPTPCYQTSTVCSSSASLSKSARHPPPTPQSLHASQKPRDGTDLPSLERSPTFA